MKNRGSSVLAALFALFAYGSTVSAADVLQSTQALIGSVKKSLGEEAINAINASPDPALIAGLLNSRKDFHKLVAESAPNWNQLLSSLSTVAPDRASRLVLLHSFLYLPPKEYIKCLDRLLDLFEKGAVTRDEFVYIFLIPPREENRWFLSYNYDSPHVGAFLKRVRAAFESDKNIVSLLDFIADGNAKLRDDRLRKEKPGQDKRKIPRIDEP